MSKAKESTREDLPTPDSATTHGASLEDYKRRAAGTAIPIGATTHAPSYAEGYREAEARLLPIIEAERDAKLPMHLITWLKSINAFDEDTPLSEMCKRAVSLAVAAEREECAKLAGDGQRWGRTVGELEMCNEIATAIRARNDVTTETGKMLTDVFPDGILANGAGEILTPPTLPHLRSLSGTETMDLPVVEVNNLAKATNALPNHNVIVDGTLYGIDEVGIYRTREPNARKRAFAAPVLPYITEHGWKWEEVRVTYFADTFVVYWNDSKGVKLAYNVKAEAWSVPLTI